MLNPTSLLADALGRNLAETYRRIYGDREPHIASGLDEAARLVIERIASSDALYHDVQHTALVTLCVQDILRGRRLERAITPSDWGHTILAALNHDIGYVRGICPGDTAEHFVIDAAGNTVTPPRGASDAFLMPYHVERGKIMVRERFAPVPYIDEERIAAAIELTRFPVPDDEDHAATDTEAGLVRAGDLIGQLGDPLYLRKLNALYHEFVETGINEKLGYSSPADMVDRYPQFYWSKVERYIGDALRYLEMTMEGKQWTATLYSHIFAIEHNRRRMGPQPGPRQQSGVRERTTPGRLAEPFHLQASNPCTPASTKAANPPSMIGPTCSGAHIMTCQPAWQLPIRHRWRRRAWGLAPTGQNDRTPQVWPRSLPSRI